jgi:subtilase family serine protease
MVHSLVRTLARRIAPLAIGATTIGAAALSSPAATAAVTFHPNIADVQFISASETPPTEAQCNSVARRCFNPTAEEVSYNLPPLYAQGLMGQGQTIVIVDSFGSETIKNDLHVFNNAFSLPHMCGEANYACQPGDPTFSELQQGNTSTNPNPGKSPGQENRAAWALEVSLDVEWSHSMAPKANILLVTTPTAETLGVQGFPDFFKAEDFVITHHLGSVISQSFASAEEAFGSSQSLLNLRFAFQDAVANHVTVFGSSGDGGTSNILKTPVKAGGTVIPFPTVEWPASDPLVTGVGGTYECTNPTVGSQTADQTQPPSRCKAGLNPTGDRELGWVASGGGYSHVFSRPDFQSTLPAGSTAIPSGQRGVPDIALQASATTGMLVYITNPGYTGIACPGGTLCSSGWYVVGGTSSSSPQWAGLIAIANQLNQRLHPGAANLGYINPALYKMASNHAMYAADFYDVTHGPNNNPTPTAQNPGYPDSTGWDPVTGLGTPNAANLIPDLVATVSGP